MSSGDRSANLATSCASGRSDLRQAHISRSTRKRSGLGMPAPSEEGFRAVSSDASCRFAVSAQLHINPQTSLERLVPSSRILTAWKLLPNLSRWVLQIIKKGFMGVFFTKVAPQQVLVMEQEVKPLLEKGAIEYIPHSNRETGLYSQYFIVPKKDGGVVSHFRSSSSERLYAAQVQNVNFETIRATDQIRGLVCHDRSQGCILPHIHPSISQEVPEVRSWGQNIPILGSSVLFRFVHKMHRCSPVTSLSSGYSHNELHRRLVDSSSVASIGSSASRCRSCPHERVEVTAKRQKECDFSTSEDHFSWRGMGLNVDAGAPVTGTYRVHPVSCKKYKARPVTHCKQFQILLGLMAAASNMTAFGLLYMRTLQWWLRTKGFSLRGNPFSHNQGHAAMLTYLDNVEETLAPVPGSHVGSFLSSQDANNRCLSHGLGSDLRGTLKSGSVEESLSLMAHQPSGDVGCISCLKIS